MNDIEKEIVLALADCNMNVAKTSRKIYMHRNTIEYYSEKIKKNTGLNPRIFYDLVKLVEIAKAT